MNKFNNFIKSIIENMDVVSVLGNDGPYDTSDARNPKILGGVRRRNPKKHRKRKKSM